MTTKQIKSTVKQITGYNYVSVRNGTGSMRGLINIFTSINDNCSLKPFENELKKVFGVEIFSYYTLTIKA